MWHQDDKILNTSLSFSHSTDYAENHRLAYEKQKRQKELRTQRSQTGHRAISKLSVMWLSTRILPRHRFISKRYPAQLKCFCHWDQIGVLVDFSPIQRCYDVWLELRSLFLSRIFLPELQHQQRARRTNEIPGGIFAWTLLCFFSFKNCQMSI